MILSIRKYVIEFFEKRIINNIKYKSWNVLKNNTTDILSFTYLIEYFERKYKFQIQRQIKRQLLNSLHALLHLVMEAVDIEPELFLRYNYDLIRNGSKMNSSEQERCDCAQKKSSTKREFCLPKGLVVIDIIFIFMFVISYTFSLAVGSDQEWDRTQCKALWLWRIVIILFVSFMSI